MKNRKREEEKSTRILRHREMEDRRLQKTDRKLTLYLHDKLIRHSAEAVPCYTVKLVTCGTCRHRMVTRRRG